MILSGGSHKRCAPTLTHLLVILHTFTFLHLRSPSLSLAREAPCGLHNQCDLGQWEASTPTLTYLHVLLHTFSFFQSLSLPHSRGILETLFALDLQFKYFSQPIKMPDSILASCFAKVQPPQPESAQHLEQERRQPLSPPHLDPPPTVGDLPPPSPLGEGSPDIMADHLVETHPHPFELVEAELSDTSSEGEQQQQHQAQKQPHEVMDQHNPFPVVTVEQFRALEATLVTKAARVALVSIHK